jgi:amidase
VILDTFATATAMLRALRDREISAVELLELHLAQIARHNPTLNAIVTPDYDTARATAERADAAHKGSADGTLLGLPLTIKDCIDIAGLPGTAGAPAFAERRPAEDAPVVARLRAAGAVLMGKTNVPPWAGDWQADNEIFGRTNNPWDLERTPGGSTGGGAAALAAGMTPLEFGSDIGGSIRVPAAFCGVYGHRPSETAIPRSGHFPGTPFPNPATAMGVQGPLARSAEDLVLGFDTVRGADAGEDVAWRLALPAPRHERLAEFRVALLPPIEWTPVDNEILSAQDHLAKRLRDCGARVEEAQPGALADMREHFKLYQRILAVMSSVALSPDERRTQAEETRASGDPFDIAFAEGILAGAADYIRWFAQREHYRAAYREFFAEWDILLAPAFPVVAYHHYGLDIPFRERALLVNGRNLTYERGLVHPSVATLAGQPATAFPVGRTKEGLPIGLQAIGPYLEDYTPLRFAALVAQEWGGFEPPPGYRE